MYVMPVLSLYFMASISHIPAYRMNLVMLQRLELTFVKASCSVKTKKMNTL